MYKKFLYSICIISFALLSLNTNASSSSAAPPPATYNALPITAPVNEAAVTTIPTVAPIEFLNVWARSSLPPSNNSAIYLSIKNNTSQSYELVSASALAVANHVELHQSFVDEKGIVKMAPVHSIIIPANTQVDLKPGGLHIMLLDLKHSLSNGKEFQLNLNFKELGTRIIKVTVQSQP